MTDRPPFPMYVDSTMLSDFRSCPKKFELTHLHHWKPGQESIHLRAGGAFAKAIETTRKAFYGNGADADTAIGLGAIELLRFFKDYEILEDDTPKTPVGMLRAFDSYFSHYGLNTDNYKPAVMGGRPAVEITFAMPMNVAHPETGDPILFTGRFDMIAQHEATGSMWVVDEKTTGYLGKSWFANWPLRSQLSAYCAAARSYGYNVEGAIIRGVAIRKTGIDHAESIQYRPQWELDRWWNQAHRDIERMRRSWEDGYFDWNLDQSCSSYGGCMFQSVCTSENPERWLPVNFVKRVWDPLAHREAGE